MENIVCQLCHQQCDEPVFLQCKHPICSKCAQTQFSSELFGTLCDHFPLNTEHKQEERKQEIHDEKQAVNICCSKCNEKTILIFSQGDIKLANNQQMSAENDGLDENQQQQHIPDEMLQWVFQFLKTKELFKRIRFTCKQMDRIVCTSLLSLNCQRLCMNELKFAREVLSKETQLQELNLMENNIEATEIAKILPMLQQLQILNLSWNNIGNPGATALANSVKHLTQLQVLDISWNPIEDSDRVAISNATKELTTFQKLEINEKCSKKVHDRMMEAFNRKGTELSLSDCNIGTAGAMTLATVLPYLPQLQRLFLSDNQFGDTGATAFVNSITKLTQLHFLGLSMNQIGDIGATAFVNSITKLTQLSQLDLSQNQIGDTGATALANSIGHLTQLYGLFLDDNQIGDTGITAIANSISNLTQLLYLSLHINQVGDTGATSLANCISTLTRLKYLSLHNNNISDDVKLQLKGQCGGKLRVYDYNH